MDYLFPILIGLGCLVILLRLIAWKMPKPQPVAYGTDDTLDDVQPTIKSSRDNVTFERIRREQRVHTFGKRAALAAPYDNRKPTIMLTPRMVEWANKQRKLQGRPALNRVGIQNAISHPWDRYGVQQPRTSDEWLIYLVMYECFLADHTSPTVSGTGGFTIDPNVPYNGQGGEYGGAGASSVTSAVADVAPQPDVYAPVAAAAMSDSAPSYSSDPTPSSVPDPSPSYSSSDSYSSSSSDSGSSSSDSGSSSSGGGDGS